jgi:hypothetical protein
MLGLIPLFALAVKRVSRTETTQENHRFDPCAAQAVHA